MAGMNNAPGKFPAPYLNDCKVDSSVMEYIDFDHMGIGARKSGVAKSSEVKRDDMSISHVGGSATGKK